MECRDAHVSTKRRRIAAPKVDASHSEWLLHPFSQSMETCSSPNPSTIRRSRCRNMLPPQPSHMAPPLRPQHALSTFSSHIYTFPNHLSSITTHSCTPLTIFTHHCYCVHILSLFCKRRIASGDQCRRSSVEMATSSMLCRSSVQAVAGLPSLGGSRMSSALRGARLSQMQRRSLVVSAKQDETPLPETKREPEKKDDPLRLFAGSPVEKFYRPEEERRPEDGNTSTKSLMKFDGPAPETINSRLAMLGITWAFVAEILTGQSVWEQVTEGRGLIWFLFVAPIIIGATLIPMYNKESPDSRENGPFNAQNERWNGRAAMIGLVALLVTENIYLKGPLLGFIHSSLNL